ncbi:hypothetical protein AV530_007894 [Patagioenas fasciata monilis]|uniref:WW domain-containing protein n=1 Tax=Patagioenas fasciata monilis TaxID=372326 RepID=A0A1V4JJ17_PATFA|nr:hypothetical protein AV530_007894 [Patagioenas fasciata monilis]
MSPQGRRYYVNTFTNETTWERPSSVPGTPKSPVSQSSAVNGYHVSGTPVHQLDSGHMSLRKSSGGPQAPGSPAAPRRQSKESSLTFRIKIEEEYAKNLSKLSQNSLAAQEEGTLGEAWAQLKKSLADEAEVHLKFSSKLQSEVEKPLLNFRENFKKDMKKCDHHIADLRKHLASRYAAVEKVGAEN